MIYEDVVLLVADGDAEHRDRVCRFFFQRGLKVEPASNGLECVTKIQVHEPDLLIVDLDMPWGGGDGVIAWLKETEGSSKTPAVLVLGNAPPEDLAARAGLPCRCCYQKPFQADEAANSDWLTSALARR
jgi:CheY-like chemotaxis protein